MIRRMFIAFGTGLMMVAMAWAGIGLAPVAEGVDEADLPLDVVEQSSSQGSSGVSATSTGLRVGAASVSIAPDPPEGHVWQTEGCETGFINEHTLETRKTTTPDCIYMGGRGLGASEPITAIDPDNPLMVRSVVIDDGSDAVALTQIDGVYWFGRYDSFCDGCGAYDLIEELSDAGLGIPRSGFLIAGNHSHNSPDFIGGWGGAPRWYMEQVADAIRDSITDAATSAQSARLETGEQVSRHLNADRRDFYYSPEDATFTWFRALTTDDEPTVIATVGTFSAHPVTTGYQGGLAHADWPGAFDQLMRDETGALGIAFVGGLGNMSTRQGTWETAQGLADLLPPIGEARTVDAPDVRSAWLMWDQPLTNAGLAGLRAGLFFDRTLDGDPATISAGKNPDKPCTSASPISVRTSATAVKIGDDLVITGGPGELFSNLTNTIKDRSVGAIALPLANVNDGLGYIMQSFEADPAARQALGFTDAPVEYEEAFGIDACFGDMVLGTTLGLLDQL